MNNNDINKLAEQLIAMGTLVGKSTGKKMMHQANKNTFSVYRDSKIYEKIEKNLMKIFMSCIDKKSVKKLQEIRNAEEQIIDKIFEQSGWLVSRDGVWHEENFRNVEDPEFEQHDTYIIKRDALGFKSGNYKEKPFNGYDKMIIDGEMNFLTKYKNQLDKLHKLMCEEERIMLGGYTLENLDIDYNTMRMIAEYLGYKDISLEVDNVMGGR